MVICRSDRNESQRLPEDEWCYVDILTCAAPKLVYTPTEYIPNPVRLSYDEEFSLARRRTHHILNVAAANEDTVLVLGAFGCGVFLGNPFLVSQAFKENLQEMKGYFEHVEFAIGSTDSDNYRAFKEVLG